MTRDPLSPEMRRDLENAREWHRNRVSEKGYEFAAERAVRDLFLIIDHLTAQSAEKKKYSEKELRAEFEQRLIFPLQDRARRGDGLYVVQICDQWWTGFKEAAEMFGMLDESKGGER